MRTRQSPQAGCEPLLGLDTASWDATVPFQTGNGDFRWRVGDPHGNAMKGFSSDAGQDP